MNRYHIAVVGATGAVGEEILEYWREKEDFRWEIILPSSLGGQILAGENL